MFDLSVKLDLRRFGEVVKRLSPSARAELHRELAAEIEETVREHLQCYAPLHHQSADRLGARHTGNLERATFAAAADSSSAVVTVGAKGIRRALGDIVIRPKNTHALTIPVAAMAYGRSVAELVNRGVRIFRPKGKNYLAYSDGQPVAGRSPTPLYILARKAVLKHEPGLLPDDKTIAANAAEAARFWIFGK